MSVESEQFAFEIKGKKYLFCSQGCLDKFKKSSDEGSGETVAYDLIIIGAGPVGLTAAVHASILKIATLLISKDISSKKSDSSEIKNYAEKIKAKFLQEHYLEHKIDEVVKVSRKGGIFEVLTNGGANITAYAVIIATGVKQDTEFCQELVKLNEKGEIIINPDCSTDVEGVFACGDVTNRFEKGEDNALTECTKACLSAKKYLSGMGIK